MRGGSRAVARGGGTETHASAREVRAGDVQHGPAARRARGDASPGCTRLTRAARNGAARRSCGSRLGGGGEKRGASESPSSGFVRAPVVARGGAGAHRGEPARGVAKNDGATAAPPRDAARSAAARARRRRSRRRRRRTRRPPPARRARAGPPLAQGREGRHHLEREPGGIRAWFDSAATAARRRRRLPSRAGAQTCLRRSPARDGREPNVAASESSWTPARRRAPVSVTRAPPCGSPTPRHVAIVGGGVATSAAALAPRSTRRAGERDGRRARLGSDVGVSHATSAEETATATEPPRRTATRSRWTPARTPARRGAGPRRDEPPPPPACAPSARARARARARRTRRKSASGTLGPRRARLFLVKSRSARSPSRGRSAAGRSPP